MLNVIKIRPFRPGLHSSPLAARSHSSGASVTVTLKDDISALHIIHGVHVEDCVTSLRNGSVQMFQTVPSKKSCFKIYTGMTFAELKLNEVCHLPVDYSTQAY